MIDFVKSWKGKVSVNDKEYTNGTAIDGELNFDNSTIIILHKQFSVEPPQETHEENEEFVVTVKQYMTKQASPEFDFMQKWNNDIPMPMRTMVGTVVKETRGMVYMDLYCDILEERTTICMKCGKALTNPVSQYFGVGPECGGHNYVNPFNSESELHEAVESYKKQLQNIKWSGWIIKSAITSFTPKGGN